MKRSPVQITELFYPVVRYEAKDDAEPETFAATVRADIDAEVKYFSDNAHMAKLVVRHESESNSTPYTFYVEAYAVFTFDPKDAANLYGAGVVPSLSVNVISILFSSVREFLSNATARGPYGPVLIEGVVVDVEGVRIGFDEHPNKLIPRLFGKDALLPDDIEGGPALEQDKAAGKKARKAK